MVNKKSKLMMRVLPMLIASAYAGVALAEDKIEEVVVTAQKRKEKLSEVPISITAISGAQLETRGIEGVANLNALAPNMLFKSNPGNELISTVVLRGSGTGQPAIWVDPSVGMYVDGVYIGKAQGSVFDVMELERVEVLRGPQGTLFGRNTEGGAVNMVSRRPTGVWGGSIGLELGNRNLHTERIAVDLPKMGIASISLAYRKEDQKGWAKNATGPDLGAKDKEAYRIAAKFDINKDFVVNYAYDNSNIDNTPTVTSLYAVDGWSGTFPSTFGAFLGGALQTAMSPYVTTKRPSHVSTNDHGFGLWERSKTVGHALELDYKLNDRNSLKYIYAHREMDFSDAQDIDGTPIGALPAPAAFWGASTYYQRHTTYEQDSHELQWVGNTDRLKYVGGLYYFKDDGTTLGPQNFTLFFGNAGAPRRSDYSATTKAKALYFQLDYSLTDKWTATAGFRRTVETKGGWTHNYRTTGFNGPFLANVLPKTEYEATFSGNTPMAALAYKWDETTNVFARLAKGFKSGGFSGELLNAAVTTPYKPQTSLSAEMGIKKSFAANRAQLSAAVFQTKITDQHVTQLVPGTTSSFLTNAGKSTYQGLELEGSLIPTDGWKIQGSYGYLHTKFNEYMDNALNLGPTRPLIDTAGNKKQGYAPEHTFSLNVDGRLAQTAWGTLRGIVDFTYTAESLLYSANKDLAAPDAGGSYSVQKDMMPSYKLINARLLLAGVPIGGPGTADVSLWVKNLTDEDRQLQGIDFGMMRTANWQTPRTYGISMNYKW
jgi:iron complex outermembrane receptor protein